MTQHFWESDSWHILTGWDRPLQYHFLSVYKDCANCTDGIDVDNQECRLCNGSGEVWLFDNLAAKEYPGGAMDPRAIVNELDKLGIKFPPELVRALEEDKLLDLGNVQTVWTFDKGVWSFSVRERDW